MPNNTRPMEYNDHTNYTKGKNSGLIVHNKHRETKKHQQKQLKQPKQPKQDFRMVRI